MTQIEIAILITVHNRKEKTIECLNNLYNQNIDENVNFKIYLVDDGSTDGTTDAINSMFPKVRVIKGDGTLYWNRGMYLAWTEALKDGGFDYYIWLNDDTFLYNSALRSLVESAKRFPNYIIVGTTSARGDISKITYGGYSNKELISEFRSDSVVECDYFNGNIVLVPTYVVDKIGILDPYFRHSFGDFEYGMRAKKYGIHTNTIGIIGSCDRNSPYVKWMNPKVSVFRRLKILYSPLGFNPFESYRISLYDSKKNAILTFVYLHLKAIFPRLFKQYR